MADSNPAKRRRLSPRPDPIDAPRSPSKLPIPSRPQSQDGTRSGSIPRRPSFASPTKASLSRNNPQILHRLGPSGRYEAVNTDTNPRASSVEAAVDSAPRGDQEVGADLEIPQTAIQEDTGASERTGQENDQIHDQVQTRGLSAIGISAARRRSRTPAREPEPIDARRSQSEHRNEEEKLAGPVRRSALRRSPPGGSQSQSESQSQLPRSSPTENPDTVTVANIGIVRKPALRRSPPAGSQTTSQPTSQTRSQSISTEKMELAPGLIRKSGLRRSPPQVSSQIQTTIQPETTTNQTQVELQAEPPLEPAHITPTHTRHHQATDISGQGQEQDDEPELPPTSVQRGLEDPVVTTPSTGIHDTPSRRRRRHDNTMAREAGSQTVPSKPSPPKPQSKSHTQSLAPKPLPGIPGSRSRDASTSVEDQTPSQDEDVDMSGVSRHGPRPPVDKYAAKRKLRDKLLQELQRLQEDVSLAEAENERLFNLHDSGGDLRAVAPNQSEIEELLKRSGYGNEEVQGEDVEKSLNSFRALSSFLPFSAPLARQPPPITTKDEDEPIPSHLPIEQENPLPHLQLFTPLQFSSIITVVPFASDPDASVLSTSTSSSTEVLKDIIQSHTITASSRTSSSLFKSSVSILVNTTSFSITSITLNSLSPAARPELGSFLSKIVDAKDDHVLAGNASTMFWAMGRWYEVARKRAIFWVRIEEEFGPNSEFATKARTVTTTTEKAEPKKKGRKRKDAVRDEDDDGGENQTGNGDEVEKSREEDGVFRKLTRKEYLANMGRQSNILAIPIPNSTTVVNLRAEWKISFDWTGEPENAISIGVVGGKVGGGWPASWRKSDTRNSLSKLESTFERLVKARGPLGAVRGIMSLVGGSD